MPYFLTFQVEGWADVFSRKVYRDFILENLTYCRNEKGLYLFGYVIIESRINYNHENPVRSGIVEKPEDYLYSSARNYSGIKGIIEVDYW